MAPVSASSFCLCEREREKTDAGAAPLYLPKLQITFVRLFCYLKLRGVKICTMMLKKNTLVIIFYLAHMKYINAGVKSADSLLPRDF